MGKHLEDLVARINELRKLSKEAEVARQAIDDIRDRAYGREDWTSREKIALGLEVPTSSVLGVLTTHKDVEAILNEIIDELPLDYIPRTDDEKATYRDVIAKSLLDLNIKDDDPMFYGKPKLYDAIRNRGRQIRLFPHQATRALQMQEAILYIIDSNRWSEADFDDWATTAYGAGMERLARAIPHIMTEAVRETDLGTVTGSPNLYKQFAKIEKSDDLDVQDMFFDIVTPPYLRAARKQEEDAYRLVLDGKGNFKTPEKIVDAILDDLDIPNREIEMATKADWPAFQAWRSNLIGAISSHIDNLPDMDRDDTGLQASIVLQNVQKGIDRIPRDIKQFHLQTARLAEGEARVEAAADVQGIDTNDDAVKEVLGRFNILRDQITDEDFRYLKSKLADDSRKAGSSEVGADLLLNYLDGFGRANQLLENKAAQVEGKAIQDRQEELAKEVSTPTGAAKAITNLLFQHPEWGLRYKDLAKERQDWLAQFVSEIGVEGLSTYIDNNLGSEVQNWLTEKASQDVVSKGRAGLESLLAQMGYGGIVDGISQTDEILNQWDIPKVLQDIANRPGEDPADILMEHLGLKEPARHPQPIRREPPGFPVEEELDQGLGDPFKPARVFGTEIPDVAALARFQKAQFDPSVPPFLPIAPEDRTEAQKEAYALFPDMPSMGGVEALPVSMYPTPAVSLPRGFEESGGWGVAGDTVLGPEMEAMIARSAGDDVSLIPYLRQEAIDFLPEFRSGAQDARDEWTANLMKSASEADEAGWEPKSLPHERKISLSEMIKGMRATAEGESVEFMPAFEERIATLPRVMELRKARRLRLKGRTRFV